MSLGDIQILHFCWTEPAKWKSVPEKLYAPRNLCSPSSLSHCLALIIYHDFYPPPLSMCHCLVLIIYHDVYPPLVTQWLDWQNQNWCSVGLLSFFGTSCALYSIFFFFLVCCWYFAGFTGGVSYSLKLRWLTHLSLVLGDSLVTQSGYTFSFASRPLVGTTDLSHAVLNSRLYWISASGIVLFSRMLMSPDPFSS